MAAKRIFDVKRDVVQTTNATTATLASFTVPTDAGVAMEVTCIAKTAAGDVAKFVKSALAKDIAGTLTLEGTVLSVIADILSTALLTATLTMDVSGTTARLRATGVAATNIDWQFEWRLIVN